MRHLILATMLATAGITPSVAEDDGVGSNWGKITEVYVDAAGTVMRLDFSREVVKTLRPPLGAGLQPVVSERLAKKFSRNLKERAIEAVLFLAALVSVVTTAGIVYILVKESVVFFAEVPLWLFLTDTQWTPLFDGAHFGIMVLLSGTITSSLVALCVAIPLGMTIAVYLSEFATPKAREIAKPILELLAGVPTIVYGYFALLFVTPLLQKLMPFLPGFNLLSAGIVMGVMIIPYVSQGIWYYNDPHIQEVVGESFQETTWTFLRGAYQLYSCCFVEQEQRGGYQVIPMVNVPDNITLGQLCKKAAEALARAGLDRRIDIYREIEIDDPAVRLMLGRPHRLRVRVKITAASLLFEAGQEQQGPADAATEPRRATP